jgi:hypothetical protein
VDEEQLEAFRVGRMAARLNSSLAPEGRLCLYGRQSGSALRRSESGHHASPARHVSLPFVVFFTIGRPLAGIICLILQITLIGWIRAALWAVYCPLAVEEPIRRSRSGARGELRSVSFPRITAGTVVKLANRAPLRRPDLAYFVFRPARPCSTWGGTA